jgi:hypothetical protein
MEKEEILEDEEGLEEIVEIEDEEVIINDTTEIDRILLSRFMSQTGQGVALDQRDIAPAVSLEEDLGQQELVTGDSEEKRPISYVSEEEEEKGAYAVFNGSNKSNYVEGSGVGELTFQKDLGKQLSASDRIIEEQKSFSKRSQDFDLGIKKDEGKLYSPLDKIDFKGEYKGLQELN